MERWLTRIIEEEEEEEKEEPVRWDYRNFNGVPWLQIEEVRKVKQSCFIGSNIDWAVVIIGRYAVRISILHHLFRLKTIFLSYL